MKYYLSILLILLTLNYNFNSQTILGYKMDDKDKHDQAGMLIAGLSASSYYYFRPIKWESFLFGVLSSISVGTAKELIYDKWLNKGTCDFWDGFTTGFGGLRMSTMFIIGANEHEKYLLKIDTNYFQFDTTKPTFILRYY